MEKFQHPYGEPNKVKKVSDNDTPQQKKFEKATGKDSDGAVGPVRSKVPTSTPQPSGESVEGLRIPKGVDKGAWIAAESSWRNMGGGHGVSKGTAEDQIRKHYDQIIASNEQTRKWEGKE